MVPNYTVEIKFNQPVLHNKFPPDPTVSDQIWVIFTDQSQFDYFLQKRVFADINRQSQSPNLYLVESCSLHYSNSGDREQLLSLPIQTETAYVSFQERKIFFIRLKR